MKSDTGRPGKVGLRSDFLQFIPGMSAIHRGDAVDTQCLQGTLDLVARHRGVIGIEQRPVRFFQWNEIGE